MRPSLALTALCAATALAADFQKRSYKTEIVVVTITKTVYPETQPTAAPEPEPVNKHKPDEEYHVPAPPPKDPAPPKDKPVIEDKPEPKPEPEEPKPQPQYPAPQEPKPEPEPEKPKPEEPQPQPEYPVPQEPKPEPEPQPEPQPEYQPPGGSSYKDIVLEHHNIHRTNHSASPLEWDLDLVDSARQLAESCIYDHNTDYNGGGYGQNIGYGISEQEVSRMITNLMYNEEFDFYKDMFGQAFPNMDRFEDWGHLTQILWKGTTHVGCVTLTCPVLANSKTTEPTPYTVCNYSPPGNWKGQYAENVGEPLGNTIRIA